MSNKIKIISLTLASLFVLTWCFWNKDSDKKVSEESSKTSSWYVLKEEKTYDYEWYKQYRETWYIMVHWQKVEITDKTSDQDISYYISYAWSQKWEWEVKTKEEWKKWYKEATWQKTIEEHIKDPNLTWSQIDAIVLNSWKKSMGYDNPKIRQYYYTKFKDFENGLKDKDPEVVKAVQEYKLSYENKQKEKNSN